MPFQINKSFVLCGDQTEYLRRKQIPHVFVLYWRHLYIRRIWPVLGSTSVPTHFHIISHRYLLNQFLWSLHASQSHASTVLGMHPDPRPWDIVCPGEEVTCDGRIIVLRETQSAVMGMCVD